MTKVVIEGGEHKVADVGGNVEVHVHDGTIERVLTLESMANQRVTRDGELLSDDTQGPPSLFGNRDDEGDDEPLHYDNGPHDEEFGDDDLESEG